MPKQITCFERDEVTDDMLVEAFKLFNENCGVWGQARRSRRNGPSRLRAQFLPEGSRSFYVRVTVDYILAGHAFACRWYPYCYQVCWITQLVVHRYYQGQGLATKLLSALPRRDDNAFGIVSSHPAACKALARACGDFRFPHFNICFARNNAADFIAASPIGYIKDARLRGSLFDPEDVTGLTCGVDSNFFVDHAEPFAVLAQIELHEEWPLGYFPDGHEFLLLFEVEYAR
ncbi:hypothetical protein F4818DRAFT_452772 [Hypoxylon cercidicola]|nr:hypothetical protein F4818DRAFT_452772 [Hypoxylon cercidicola]